TRLVEGNESDDDLLVALIGHHEELLIFVQGFISATMDGENGPLKLATTRGFDR
ncbi:hypothetical protein HAX54_042199, partial [Datura stramonium]|nr:hypothetical protein [Datura stramonium]